MACGICTSEQLPQVITMRYNALKISRAKTLAERNTVTKLHPVFRAIAWLLL
jgi:hypothetical protein